MKEQALASGIRVALASRLNATLVLTGVTRRENVARYSFLPTRIVDSVADLKP